MSVIQNDTLFTTARWLSEQYLANPDGEDCSFVSCITPPNYGEHHIAWQNLYDLTHKEKSFIKKKVHDKVK